MDKYSLIKWYTRLTGIFFVLVFISLVIDYINFVLQLGYEPSGVYNGPTASRIEDLDAWKDLFLGQLQESFRGADNQGRNALRRAIDHLDIGKKYVLEGKDWLTKELGLGS